MAELIIPALTTQGLALLSIGFWIPSHVAIGFLIGNDYTFSISTGTLAVFWAILAGLIHYPPLLITPALYIVLISITSACIIKVVDYRRQRKWLAYH
jgi:hypothetical protein